jgi:hypothetical protein
MAEKDELAFRTVASIVSEERHHDQSASHLGLDVIPTAPTKSGKSGIRENLQ